MINDTPPVAVVAIGMLSECGAGVAMSNAIDDCKAAADCVCGDCDEDGVAKWLEEWLS